MKLSEAIRLGTMLRPQTRQGYFANGGSCALGAALEASGYAVGECYGSEAFAHLELTFGRGFLDMTACPICDNPYRANVIPHLNDDHCWTREQIADWVETIERQHEQSQPAPVEVSEVLA